MASMMSPSPPAPAPSPATTNSPAPHSKRTLSSGVERRPSLGSNATGLLGRAVQANQAHLQQQQQPGVHQHQPNNSAGGFLPPSAAAAAAAAPGSPLRPALAPRQVASSPSRAPLPHHPSSSSASAAYTLPPHPVHASPSQSYQSNGFAHARQQHGSQHAGHTQGSSFSFHHAASHASAGPFGHSSYAHDAAAAAPIDFPFPHLLTLNRSRLLHLLEYQIKLSNSPAGADPDSAQHYAVLAAAVRLLHLQGCVHNFSFVTSITVDDSLLGRPKSDAQLQFSAAKGFTSTSKDGSPASRLTALHLLEVLAEIRNSPSPVLAPPSELPPQLLDAAIYYRPDEERIELGLPHAHALQLSPYIYHRVLALLSFLLNLHLHQLTLARVLLLLQGIERHLSYWSAHQDITTLPKPYRLWQYARWRWANRSRAKSQQQSAQLTNPYRNWSAMAARNVRELLAIKTLWTTRCGRIAIRMHQIQEFLRDSFAKGASVTAPLAPLFHHQIACNSRFFAKLYRYVAQEEMALPVAHDEHASLYSPSSHAAAASAAASAASSGATSIEAKILALHSQLAFVDSFLTIFETRFTAQFNDAIAPYSKPHHLFEWWHYYASVVVTVGVGGYIVAKNQARVKSLAVDGIGALREFMHEHAFEPLSNIYSTVFTTLRDRSLFSTNAKALVASKENLAQMLGAFAHNHAAELSKHENIPLSEYEARIPARAREGDMNLVMKTYEREIERPIKSLLIGDLMHGMLIQIQKVKVDAEAACLAADQLLQSNEINFNLTATIPVLMLAYAAADFTNKFLLRGSWSSKKVRARVQESKTILSEIEQLFILHLQSGSVDGHAPSASLSGSGSNRRPARPDMYAQLSSLRLEDLAHLSSQEAEAEDEALRMRSPQASAEAASGAAGADPAASFPPPSTPRGGSSLGYGSEIFGRLDSSEAAFASSSSPQESEDEADEFEDPEAEAPSLRTPRNAGKPASARTLFGPSAASAAAASAARSARPACPSALGLSNHAYGTSLVLIFQLSRLLSSLPLSSAFSPSSWWASRRASTDADPRTILHRDLVLLASHQLTPEQKLRWVTQMWRNYEFLKA